MYSSRTLAIRSSSSLRVFSFCTFLSRYSFSFLRSSFLIETRLSDLLLPDLFDAKAPKLSSRRSLLFDLICIRPLLRALYLSSLLLSYLYMLTRLALRCRPALRVDERRYLLDSWFSLFYVMKADPVSRCIFVFWCLVYLVPFLCDGKETTTLPCNMKKNFYYSAPPTLSCSPASAYWYLKSFANSSFGS